MEFQRWDATGAVSELEAPVDRATACVNDLIAEAAALVDRRDGGDPRTLALVGDELASAVACCDDGAVVADACEVLTQLTVALLRRRPPHDLPLAS